jgi:hypothetical protein
MFCATSGKSSFTTGQLRALFSCRQCQAPLEVPEHFLLQCMGIPELLLLRFNVSTFTLSLQPLLHISIHDSLSVTRRNAFAQASYLFLDRRHSFGQVYHNTTQIWSSSINGYRFSVQRAKAMIQMIRVVFIASLYFLQLIVKSCAFSTCAFWLVNAFRL